MLNTAISEICNIMFLYVYSQSLDSLKFAEVRHILSQNRDRPPTGFVKAPLATPEPIEISEYAQVRVSNKGCTAVNTLLQLLQNNYTTKTFVTRLNFLLSTVCRYIDC